MNATTASATIASTATADKIEQVSSRTIRSDAECRARASEFLTELVGSPPESLSWDDEHHLQGHGQVQGCELIVIAPRDDDHRTVVLTVEDWNAVRRISTAGRRNVLEECAIVDHDHLVVVLHRGQRWSAPFTAAA